MKKILIGSLALMLLASSCSPSTSVPSSTPTSILATPTPPPTPTSAPTEIIETPPPCWGADLIYHAQLQQMLLINCVEDPSSESPHVIWGWDGTQWQKVAEGGPPGRILGGAAYDEQRNALILYGGRPVELEPCSQETWEWDGETWEQKNVRPPTACDHVKMVYDLANGEAILFSGLDPTENPVNETWSWNGQEWRLLSETGPESRGHFGFVHDANHGQTLLYGGYTSMPMDDFWVWKDGVWEPIDFPGPGTLSHFGMTYDSDANALYIFGGANARSTMVSLTDKTWVLTEGSWRELNPANSPSKRGSPAMGYDPERNTIVLYGGFESSQTDLNDTWEWDGQQWTCVVNCN